jgi:leucyl-tRNA synthetase
VWRFLNRVWRLAHVFLGDEEAQVLKRSGETADKPVSAEEIERLRNVTIKRVTTDIEDDFGFNTAISAIMEFVNALYLYPKLGDDVSKQATETVLSLLWPYAPHMTEELWSLLGHKTMLGETPWPTADASKMASREFEIVIQINGKVKDKMSIPATATEEQVKTLAMERLTGKGLKIAPQRIIYVPNKLVNFVGSMN